MDHELFSLSAIDAADPVAHSPSSAISHAATETRFRFQAEESSSSRRSSYPEGASAKNDHLSFKRPRANLPWNVMFDLLGTPCHSPITRSRHSSFSGIVQYGHDHPDHNVPKSGVVTLVDGTKVNLGQWLKSQRKLRRLGKLLPQREAMLQTLIDKGESPL